MWTITVHFVHLRSCENNRELPSSKPSVIPSSFPYTSKFQVQFLVADQVTSRVSIHLNSLLLVQVTIQVYIRHYFHLAFQVNYPAIDHHSDHLSIHHLSLSRPNIHQCLQAKFLLRIQRNVKMNQDGELMTPAVFMMVKHVLI